MSEHVLDSHEAPPAALSATQPMYWSVGREIWENRSIYIAPLIVTAVVLFASMLGTFGLPKKVRNLAADPAKQQAVVEPYSVAPAPIMLTTILVGFFYALDALYGERRDRGILFWKSLPVSDVTAVLSKASIPFVVLPSIGFLLSVITMTILMFWGTVVLLGSGTSPARLWAGYSFFQDPLIMFYGLAAHTLWFAPIYGWLLLLSAWVRRTPILWAVLPPFAIFAFERIVFGTKHFASMLRYRFAGAMTEAFTRSDGNISGLSDLAPVKFFTTPGLWVGLIAAAAFLAAAVRLRRNREPI